MNEGEPRLARTLRTGDGLAVVVGIMVGSGIFRTPGTVAALLGRPGLTFVAWALGGAVGFLGAFVFAELSTRYPQAGGCSSMPPSSRSCRSSASPARTWSPATWPKPSSAAEQAR